VKKKALQRERRNGYRRGGPLWYLMYWDPNVQHLAFAIAEYGLLVSGEEHCLPKRGGKKEKSELGGGWKS